MGLLLIFVVMLFLGFVLAVLEDKVEKLKHNDGLSMVSAVFVAIGLMVTVVLLIVVPANRYSVKAFIEEHKVLQETIDAYRDRGDVGPEMANMALKVAESNQSIVRCQYAHKSFFLNIFNPKEVMDVEIIK